MLKSTIVALFLSCCALVTVGCLTPDDPDEIAPLVSDSLTETPHELELNPAPLCPDLNNVPIQGPQGCMRDGQLGTQICRQTCNFDRVTVFTPTGTTCQTVSVDCTPWVCGVCQVFGPEVPVP